MNKHIIDIGKVIRILWNRKKVFFIMWPIVFVVACIWILPKPRYYTCEVRLAPEGSVGTVDNIARIASSYGINLGSMGTEDAISPNLYPELFDDPTFLVGLMNVAVRTSDGSVETDYYTYRSNYSKHDPFTYPFTKLKSKIMNWISPPPQPVKLNNSNTVQQDCINPFSLTNKEFEMMRKISKDIKCSVINQTGVIVLAIKDQDRLVCALMADSTKSHLQDFITRYRTQKVREDLEYYQKLISKAEDDYRSALADYCEYTDNHVNSSRQVIISEIDRLRNEMNLKLDTYNSIKTQLSVAEAKVQERTPAFTTIKSASIPVKAAGPKRVNFVLGMLIFSTVIASVWLTREELFPHSNNAV